MTHRQPNRRDFLKTTIVAGAAARLVEPASGQQPPTIRSAIRPLAPGMRWLRSARVFLIDGYGYPFTPDLEFDARALAETMADVGANVVRMTTMGKYATIQGVRFSRHPAQGDRDLLAETIAACKPRGIRVVPYISTEHKLAWSMVTRDYPEYAQVMRPGGGPARSQFGTGEDHGTVCWNTPYRGAFLELVEHVVRDYEIDGIYFDSWMACYFFPRPATCYCPGCREGFKQSTGLAIPYHEKLSDYTPAEQETVRRYHAWYQDRLMDVLAEVRRIVKRHRDIPLIYNINNPERLMGEDLRVLAQMDAFLYERGASMLHRAEGVSLARALGLAVWPYCSHGVSTRVASGGRNIEQEILVTAMFGGGPIIYNGYQYVRESNERGVLRRPLGIIARNADCFEGAENQPYAAVVWGSGGPFEPSRSSDRPTADVRSSTLGAFAACVHRHVQVSSALPAILDDPARLARYKVLYLANMPHLAREQIENIRAFVSAGGGLVASHATSLYRQEGRSPDRPVHLYRQGFAWSAPKLVAEDRFALEELFKVRPQAPMGERAALIQRHTAQYAGLTDLYLRARPGSPLCEMSWAGKLVPVCEYQPVAVLRGATVAADIVAGERQAVLPAIVLSRFGNGRVAYLAPALESLYLQTNLDLPADVIRSLVLWAAGEPPPYTVEGPERLVANMTIAGDTRVLHLANWTGNKLEQPGLDEYYLGPIENVRVRIRKPVGRKIADLRLLVDSVFDQRDLGDQVEIHLPRIDAYQAIRFRCL